VYIQEYPQFGIPGGTDSGFIDLIDAFYNDAPYTGIWEDQTTMPSDLVDVGEEFHVCIEDTQKDATLACYELENGLNQSQSIYEQILTISLKDSHSVIF
jgi:hypothetical protein